MEIPLKPTLSSSSSAPAGGRRESDSYSYASPPTSPDDPSIPPLPQPRQHRHHHNRHHHHHHHHHANRSHRGGHTPEANVTSERVSKRIVESGLESPVPLEEGLRWKYAREHIWATAERILAAKLAALPPLSVKIFKALRLGMNYLILYCFLVLLIAYSVVEWPDEQWTLTVILILNFALNVALEVVTSMSRDREAIYRLYDALHSYKQAMAGQSFLSPIMAMASSASVKQGSSLVSISPVYRDGTWQRVPTLMLVKGDLIALATGDVAPVRVEPYMPGYASDLGGPVSALRGDLVERGERITFRAEHRDAFMRKCSLTPSSKSLLLLCGDMRCFRVCETPMDSFLEETLSPSGVKPTEPLLSRHLSVIVGLSIWTMLILISAHIVIATIRLIVYKGEAEVWVTSILIQPVHIALLFLPLSTPTLSFAAEAISTARLLTVVDKLQLVAGHKAAAAAATSGSADNSQDKRQGKGKGKDKNKARRTSRGAASMEEGPMLGEEESASEQSFEELDVDQRVNLRSKKASQGRISAVRFGQYLSATVRARLLLPWCRPAMLADALPSEGGGPIPTPTHGNVHAARSAGGQEGGGDERPPHLALSVEDEGEGVGVGRQGAKRVLPVPLARTRMVERLGGVTMVTVVDDELVCQSSAPEELFLLNSREEHEAPPFTILRTMHEDRAPRGPQGSSLRFEDPHWYQHMASLKPLGLTCLASTLTHDGMPTATGTGTGLQPYPPVLDSGSYTEEGPTDYVDLSAEELLVRYVTEAPPRRQYLSDLGREIGFCDEDLATFRPRFCLHVLAPHLADEMAQEDTHALSVEETRHRGHLQPHIFSVVMEDLRNGGMHLLSQGNPSLVLPMCYDYWDGRALNGLSAEDRQVILERHQHWVLEDFDVVALCYTPVPHLMHKAIASRAPLPLPPHGVQSLLPVYLVDNFTEAQQVAHLNAIREQAHRERQARRVAAQEAAAANFGDAPPDGAEDGSKASRGHRGTGVGVGDSEGEHGDTEEGHAPSRAEGDEEMKGVVMEGIKLEMGDDAATGDDSSVATSAPLTGDEAQALGLGVDGAAPPLGSPFNDVPMPGPMKSYSASALFGGGEATPVPSSSSCHGGDQGVEPGLVAEKLRAIPMRPKLLRPHLSERGILSPCPSEPSRRASHGGAGGGQPKLKRASSLDDVLASSNSSSHRKGVSPAASDDVFWALLQKQVFLGLVASNVLPKRDVPGFVEDIMAAGVRFVYFSPRNMRRTKSLAEKMGIETGWNCAISLRALESSGVPDEHRLVGEDIYGEWDVKARLPHGVEAIRKHLHSVDNVPLLVSLFTDATPQTIGDMVGIFHEHHESVLCVGYGFRATNARLFRTADMSISLEGLPGLPKTSDLPARSPNRFSVTDATFNEDVIALNCAFSLRHHLNPPHTHSHSRASSGPVSLPPRKVSVSLLLDVIREGRRVLANLYQMAAMAAILIFTCSLYIVLARLLPIPQPGTLDGLSVLWLLWVVLPALSLPMLDTQADGGILTRCPRKNVVKGLELGRALGALLARCLPSVLTCMYIHTRALGCLLAGLPECGDSVDVRGVPYNDSDWWTVLRCPPIRLHPVQSRPIRAAMKQADDVVLAALVLLLTVQSAGVLYRTQPIWMEVPFRNLAWVVSAGALLTVQILHLVLHALHRNTHHHLVWIAWDVWAVMGVMPLVILLIGEQVKSWDRKVFDLFERLLKLEFNTRLGTHSPR